MSRSSLSYAAFGPVEAPVTTPSSQDAGAPILPFVIVGALGIGLAAFLVGSGRVPGSPRES
jgi:hypothetical protein